MPQELHVLRCYNCEAFQVDIVKKVPKWECKICGEKQSVIKVYAKGSGKDCRLHVQQLNQKRLEAGENINQNNSKCTVLDFTDNTVNNSSSNAAKKINPWMEFMPINNITTENESEIQNSVSIINNNNNKSQCFKLNAHKKFKKDMNTENVVQNKPQPVKYYKGYRKQNNESGQQLKLMSVSTRKNSDYNKLEKPPAITIKSSFDTESGVNFKNSYWEDFNTVDSKHIDGKSTKKYEELEDEQLYHKQKFQGFHFKADDKQSERSHQQLLTSDVSDIKFSDKKIQNLQFKIEKCSPKSTNQETYLTKPVSVSLKCNTTNSENIKTSRWTEFIQTDNDEDNHNQDLYVEKSIFDLQNLPINKLQHLQNVYRDVNGQNTITDALHLKAAGQNKETEISNNTNSKCEERKTKGASLFDGETSDIESIFQF